MRFRDEDFIYRIMGIDNGSSALGMVVADLDLRQNTYLIQETDTLVAQKLMGRHTGLALSHGDAWARLNTLHDTLVKCLEYYHPHAVAVETPFFMPGRVQAFKVLTEMMVFIRQAVETYGLDTDIVQVTPGQAKAAVQTANFTMKKTVIPDCVRRMPNIHYRSGIDYNNLSEHEYDAIAAIVYYGNQVRRATGFDRDE